MVVEKRIETQANLERSRCTKEHYLTCKDTHLHSNLVQKHGCMSSILTMGRHLKTLMNEDLPECTNMDLLKVSMKYFLVQLQIKGVYLGQSQTGLPGEKNGQPMGTRIFGKISL